MPTTYKCLTIMDALETLCAAIAGVGQVVRSRGDFINPPAPTTVFLFFSQLIKHDRDDWTMVIDTTIVTKSQSAKNDVTLLGLIAEFDATLTDPHSTVGGAVTFEEWTGCAFARKGVAALVGANTAMSIAFSGPLKSA